MAFAPTFCFELLPWISSMDNDMEYKVFKQNKILLSISLVLMGFITATKIKLKHHIQYKNELARIHLTGLGPVRHHWILNYATCLDSFRK